MGAGDAQGGVNPARWPSPIFLDQSLPKAVRTAFELVHDDPRIMHPDMDDCAINVGDDDETWLPYVGKKDWIVIMRDKHIETRPGEQDAHMRHGVRSFVLSEAGNMSKWDIVDLLVRRWPRIIEFASDGTPGPWMYSVTHYGRFKKLLPRN